MKEEKKTKRKYSQEFKADAVKLADELGSASKASTKLGINTQSLGNWIKKAKTVTYASSQEELEALRAENKKLRKEIDEQAKINEILKKATAFFSQDQNK